MAFPLDYLLPYHHYRSFYLRSPSPATLPCTFYIYYYLVPTTGLCWFGSFGLCYFLPYVPALHSAFACHLYIFPPNLLLSTYHLPPPTRSAEKPRYLLPYTIPSPDGHLLPPSLPVTTFTYQLPVPPFAFPVLPHAFVTGVRKTVSRGFFVLCGTFYPTRSSATTLYLLPVRAAAPLRATFSTGWLPTRHHIRCWRLLRFFYCAVTRWKTFCHALCSSGITCVTFAFTCLYHTFTFPTTGLVLLPISWFMVYVLITYYPKLPLVLLPTGIVGFFILPHPPPPIPTVLRLVLCYRSFCVHLFMFGGAG